MRSLRSIFAVVAATAALAAAMPALAAAPPPTVHPDSYIVAKIDSADGYRISGVTAGYPVTVRSAVLASRGIYLLQPTDPRVMGDAGKVAHLAATIAQADGVVYAEPDEPIQLADTQFHSWPYGTPTGSHTAAQWAAQPLVTTLDLAAAHSVSTGAGVTVAVLDTGADPAQPTLAGRLVPGWNYVDDDADTSDPSVGLDADGDGRVDSAAGHGTFVSGTVALIAPGARIMPMRVLNSDGYGNLFVVAQAILDAVDAGAQVINLSFGTADTLRSKLLREALSTARKRGVLVVAAAGNDANDRPHFPAAEPGVVSVAALVDATRLASFSDYGGWVAVAAPGQDLIGPLPGNRYAEWSGTSVAAPVVAGQAALLRAFASRLPVDKLSDVLKKTARAIPRAKLGHGRIDINASLALAAHTH